MITEKLYDTDAYLKEFTATVQSCSETENGYGIVLDRTAFFPEGGGQSSDTGLIDCAQIVDVQEKDGIIIHYSASAVSPGSIVKCTVCWEKRYRNMQNHSGEHIISGLINKYFGYNNVGFHIGRDGVTVDLDGELSREQLDMIETEANNAVYSCSDIKAYYPSEEELSEINYRSKIDLNENVRIVIIGNYDVCACCAPHVKNTGEIGLIKILDSEKYKGGTRIKMLCGADALEDYRMRYSNIYDISVLLSSKQSEAAEAVRRLLYENGEEKRIRSEIKRELIELKISGMKFTEGNMCIFDNKCDMNDLRALVNEGINKCTGICAAFSGNDKKGYQYVISAKNINMKEHAQAVNKALNGKGGGSSMIQGSVLTDRKTIEEFINSYNI